MNISPARFLAVLALAGAALVGCSDDDAPDPSPLDGGVDSGARDASLDARPPSIDSAVVVDASTACADGGFNPGTGCRAWTECPANTYVSAPGTATADRACTPCPDGQYSAGNNATACKAVGQ